jgi:hypothetical protein
LFTRFITGHMTEPGGDPVLIKYPRIAAAVSD